MKVFALALLAIAPMLADSAMNPPAVACSLIQITNPISVPSASGALTSYGVLVQAFSDDDTVSAYMVTVSYADAATLAKKTRTQLFLRVHNFVNQLSETIIWTGQPVVNVSCMVIELKPGNSSQASTQ